MKGKWCMKIQCVGVFSNWTGSWNATDHVEVRSDTSDAQAMHKNPLIVGFTRVAL